MREYVTKNVGFWYGGDHLRRVRKTTYARSYAQHPVEERILDYLEPGLVLITVLTFVGVFVGVSVLTYWSYLSAPGGPFHAAGLTSNAPVWMVWFSAGILGAVHAIFIGACVMLASWILYHLIPRLMGYRRVPKWELDLERRARLLATLDEKERARYLLEEDARDQAYRRGVATGYMAGRNSGRWYY